MSDFGNPNADSNPAQKIPPADFKQKFLIGGTDQVWEFARPLSDLEQGYCWSESSEPFYPRVKYSDLIQATHVQHSPRHNGRLIHLKSPPNRPETNLSNSKPADHGTTTPLSPLAPLEPLTVSRVPQPPDDVPLEPNFATPSVTAQLPDENPSQAADAVEADATLDSPEELSPLEFESEDSPDWQIETDSPQLESASNSNSNSDSRDPIRNPNSQESDNDFELQRESPLASEETNSHSVGQPNSPTIEYSETNSGESLQGWSWEPEDDRSQPTEWEEPQLDKTDADVPEQSSTEAGHVDQFPVVEPIARFDFTLFQPESSQPEAAQPVHRTLSIPTVEEKVSEIQVPASRPVVQTMSMASQMDSWWMLLGLVPLLLFLLVVRLTEIGVRKQVGQRYLPNETSYSPHHLNQPLGWSKSDDVYGQDS